MSELKKILLFCEDNKTFFFYEKIFSKKNYFLYNSSFEDITAKSLDYEFAIFDLTSISLFEKIQSLDSYFYKTIYILPFLIDERKKYLNTCFLKKPINLEELFSYVDQTFTSSKFLKRKTFYTLKNLLDNSLLPVGVFHKNKELYYSNNQYKKLFDIDEKKKYFFDEIGKFTYKFHRILSLLKKDNIVEFLFNTNEKTYKVLIYKIDSFFVTILFNFTKDYEELESYKQAAYFFQESNEAVLITDDKGLIKSVNKAFCTITGYSKDEVIGKKPSILKSGVQLNDFYEHLWDSLVYYGKWQGEVWNKRKNGEIYPEWLSISTIIDPHTKKKNYMAFFSDISSVKEIDKKLEFYANYDYLTGLLNRVQFDILLQQTIKDSKRSMKKFALMFIDIDHFKDVNDSFGHDVGDFLLKIVSKRLKDSIRSSDIIARIGGDEFNIILKDINYEQSVLDFCEKLNSIVNEKIVIYEHTFYISLSIGIAIYPKHGLDKIQLIKNADTAMYEVKRTGRGKALVYDLDITNRILGKITIQNDLKEAIKDKEIEVYYQPVLNLKTKKVENVEVLARWFHRTKGFISPEKFVKVAEEQGLIIELTNLIMQKAFKDFEAIYKKVNCKNFMMALNVSAVEFFDEDFISRILEYCKDYKIHPSNIELEITETHIMKKYELAIDKIKTLKEYGFSFAIDDFGTGYSSLNYLKKFPVNKLKIDKSFVSDILENSDDRAIVKTIVNIAKIFGFKIQAEGVENKEQELYLKELQTQYTQGYYYSKPVELKELLVIIGEINAK